MTVPIIPPDAQDVETRLKSLTDYVQDCERRVLRGEIMDMQGLDRNVLRVCEDLAALPRDAARGLEGKMTGLVEKLDALAASIRAQQEQARARG